MSATRETSHVVECQYPGCTEYRRKWELHHGKYCSNTCEVKHDGRETLARLVYDHTRCATCFRELKTINPPKPDFEFTENGHGWTLDENGNPTLEYYSQEVTRDAAVGFQFGTEHSTKGEKQRGDTDTVVTGTICEKCGNTDHTHHDPVLADHDALGRLVQLLDEMDDVAFDPVVLHRTYEHHRDLDLAVGQSLTN